MIPPIIPKPIIPIFGNSWEIFGFEFLFNECLAFIGLKVELLLEDDIFVMIFKNTAMQFE